VLKLYCNMYVFAVITPVLVTVNELELTTDIVHGVGSGMTRQSSLSMDGMPFRTAWVGL